MVETYLDYNSMTPVDPRVLDVMLLVFSETFEKTYHQRSIVESVFSSFKCRFTKAVLAKKLATQRLQLLLRCVCYNLLS